MRNIWEFGNNIGNFMILSTHFFSNHSSHSGTGPSSEQQAFEGASEFGIENRVNDGIHEGIHVALKIGEFSSFSIGQICHYQSKWYRRRGRSQFGTIRHGAQGKGHSQCLRRKTEPNSRGKCLCTGE
jgi:hypothetical protein